MAVAARVRREIEAVALRDRDFGSPQAVLQARIAAVIEAQRAVVAREVGAGPALRQSLVDLAAVSEAIAAELPEPLIASRR